MRKEFTVFKCKLVLVSISIGLFLFSCQVHQKELLPDYARIIDFHGQISAESFSPTAEFTWQSESCEAQFPFDEIIYSWQVTFPPGEGFRLYLRVGFPDGEDSPWLYAGYWGSVKLLEYRTNPTFEYGQLLMDDLQLSKLADSYQFLVKSGGENPLTVLPGLHVVYTNHDPTKKQKEIFRPRYHVTCAPRVLDLPLRLQIDSQGNSRPDRCQSAALATALQYFGHEVALETLIDLIYDQEYDYPGIWPRVIGAADQLGFSGYIARFRDWNGVCQELQEGKVLLCSIRLPEGGDYISPPYPSMENHIVALNGLTEDGRVIVTDSALEDGYLLQWLRPDFEKAWFVKGGVAMVIEPPVGFTAREVVQLPPYPRKWHKAVD
jgi:hypothetical protein